MLTTPLRIIGLFIFLFLVAACENQPEYSGPTRLHPEPIGDDEGELRQLREKWIALSHPAAPWVSWKDIEFENAIEARILKSNLRLKKHTSLSESFGNGMLQGDWEEKGPLNQAGSIVAADYDPATNQLFVMSDGGSLWRNTGLAVNNWTLLNDDYQFNSRVLQVINKTGGGRRIITGYNQVIYYSDNEGASLNAATGLNYPVAWGGNNILQLIAIKGSPNILYALVVYWDDVAWDPRIAIYRSVNDGASFSKIYTFSHGDTYRVELVLPYNSSSLLAFESNTATAKWNCYQVEASVSLLNQVNATVVASSCAISGNKVSGNTSLYMLANNRRLFRSNNFGASWTLQSVLPENAWDRIDVSMDDANLLSNGGVNAFRSINGGSNWFKVNDWWEYYDNISGKLHADMMEIKQFRKQDGTTFTILNNHGGVAISYDHLLTTTNLSTEELKSAQFYDIITPPGNDSYQYIYAGAQDQGLQRTSTSGAAGTQLFDQLISGDYGYLTMASNNQVIHALYPGGVLHSFTHPANTFMRMWTMPGSFKPNYSWMIPMEPYYKETWDTVLMAGGDITGGDGSYLVKVAMGTTNPYPVFTSQYPFNFKANSTSGTSGITAIEAPPLQPNKLYVALENGNFFYSNNYGQNWTMTTNFTGPEPWYLYGSTIVSSRLTPNLLWYGGSGYSNPAVYKSTNGGVSFENISNGLPATLVHEIVANIPETLLFAATEAGPYMYVVADNQWYSMAGINTPIQNYTSVEFIPNTNTVRFSTYGRGIWDFKIQTPALYVYTGNGGWGVAGNWSRSIVPPNPLPTGAAIYINPEGNGIATLNIPQTIATKANIIVAPGKQMVINGNLQVQ